MEITEYPTYYQIYIPYNYWVKVNTKRVKEIPNRRFDYEKKVWIIPISQRAEVLQLAQKCYAKIKKIENLAPEVTGEIPQLPDLDFDLPIHHPEGYALRLYQRKGVARGLQLKRFINGDDMGLGKTCQSISTIYGASLKGEDVFPCLIICPAAVKINWQREWQMWSDRKAIVLDDSNKNTWTRFFEMKMADVFITNYESLRKFFVLKMPIGADGKIKKRYKSTDIMMNPKIDLFKSVIIDESHRLKDPSTQQTKITLRITMNKKWVIALTGTPVVNKPIDLFPQLAMLSRHNQFGGLKGYKNRYCDGGRGASNLKELNYLLNKRCFFRRDKSEVLTDLPDKQRQTMICNITTRKEYQKAENDFVNFLKDKGCDDVTIARKLRGEIMVKMGELKKLSAFGKIDATKEFITEVLDSGHKVIIFAIHHFVVDALVKLFPNSVTITGRENSEQKQANVDKFQKDENTKVAICNIKAAGTGITLTSATNVVFVEYPWTDADCTQCEDRAYRLGQKNNVMCTYFLGQNTIDEKLYKMIQDKKHTANTITGKEDNIEMQMNFVDEVLNLFKK